MHANQRECTQRATRYGVTNLLTRGAVGESECLAFPRTGEPAASTRSLASPLLMWANIVSHNEQQTYA